MPVDAAQVQTLLDIVSQPATRAQHEQRAKELLTIYDGNLERAVEEWFNPSTVALPQPSTDGNGRPVPPVPTDSISQQQQQPGPTDPPAYQSWTGAAPPSQQQTQNQLSAWAPRLRSQTENPQPETIDLTQSAQDGEEDQEDEQLRKALEASLRDTGHSQSYNDSGGGAGGFPSHNHGNEIEDAQRDLDLQRAIQMSTTTSSHQGGDQQQQLDEATILNVARAAARDAGKKEEAEANFWLSANGSSAVAGTTTVPSASPAGLSGVAASPLGWDSSSPAPPCLRPELLKVTLRSRDLVTEQQAPAPGLVAHTPVQQVLIAFIQALYAVPQARKAILQFRPVAQVVKGPVALDGYWLGEAPIPAASLVETNAAPSAMESSEAGGPTTASPHISGSPEERVPNPAVDDEQSSKEAGIAAKEDEEEATKVTMMDVDSDSEPVPVPALGGEGSERDEREADLLTTKHGKSVALLQRLQVLFSVMQASCRGWIYPKEVTDWIDVIPSLTASLEQGQTQCIISLQEELSLAIEVTARYNARLRLEASIVAGEVSVTPDDWFELLLCHSETLMQLFYSQGVHIHHPTLLTADPTRPAPYEALTPASTLVLDANAANTSVSLALRDKLLDPPFLIHDAAEVMVFSVSHGWRTDAQKFTYDDPLHLDRFMWSCRKGKPLETPDYELTTQLAQERKDILAAQHKFNTFKGEKCIEIVQRSIAYFQNLAEQSTDQDVVAAAKANQDRLVKVAEGLKAADQQLNATIAEIDVKYAAAVQGPVEEFVKLGEQPEWQTIRYELKALICPVGSPLFPSGALTLVKAAKGDWWRFSPSVGTASGGSKATGSGGAGLEPGHIQRLTREEVDTFDQLHAVTAIYARQETEQEAEMSLTPIWVSEYLKNAVEADNAKAAQAEGRWTLE